MENDVQKSSTPFLRILKARLIWIILIAVVFVIAGYCYGKFIAKPVYKASCDVIVKLRYVDENLTDSGDHIVANSNKLNDFSLAQRMMPTIVDIVESPNVIGLAKTKHFDEGINRDSFNTSYDKDSLIFNISYVDYDPELAKGRLEDVFETFKEYIPESEEIKEIIIASDIEFVKTQNNINVTVSDKSKNSAVISGAAGVGVAVLLFVLIYLFDNKVKTVTELEEITGVDVLATISK